MCLPLNMHYILLPTKKKINLSQDPSGRQGDRGTGTGQGQAILRPAGSTYMEPSPKSSLPHLPSPTWEELAGGASFLQPHSAALRIWPPQQPIAMAWPHLACSQAPARLSSS